MATSCGDQKWEHFEDDEEEEEALSLCDLPVNLAEEENDNNDRAETKEEEGETDHEEFDFGPWKGSFCIKSPEMCVADDIFYQGQILPLRVSISSETSLIPINSKEETVNSNVTCLSRSESQDHCGFTSFSSRSSSSRNIIQTQFHSYPSPKPQLRLTRPSMESSRSRKSSVWDFFRLGPVRIPEIELHDLKARSSVSRNSSCSSNNSNPCTKMIRTNEGKKNQRKPRLLSGCSCTDRDVQPVPMSITVIRRNKDRNYDQVCGYERMVAKKVKRKEGVEGGRKQAMSRHRTYEWIKEL